MFAKITDRPLRAYAVGHLPFSPPLPGPVPGTWAGATARCSRKPAQEGDRGAYGGMFWSSRTYLSAFHLRRLPHGRRAAETCPRMPPYAPHSKQCRPILRLLFSVIRMLLRSSNLFNPPLGGI